MNTEECKKLAKRVKMPKHMWDTESCREALVKFADEVTKVEREACRIICEKTANELVVASEEYQIGRAMGAEVCRNRIIDAQRRNDG